MALNLVTVQIFQIVVWIDYQRNMAFLVSLYHQVQYLFQKYLPGAFLSVNLKYYAQKLIVGITEVKMDKKSTGWKQIFISESARIRLVPVPHKCLQDASRHRAFQWSE